MLALIEAHIVDLDGVDSRDQGTVAKKPEVHGDSDEDTRPCVGLEFSV